MVGWELSRRDKIRGAILGLPVADQLPAREAEAKRRRQWEQWRTEHAQRWAGGGTPSTGESICLDDATPAETSKLARVSRWAQRNLKVVLIPLVSLRKQASGLAET